MKKKTTKQPDKQNTKFLAFAPELKNLPRPSKFASFPMVFIIVCCHNLKESFEAICLFKSYDSQCFPR
jgi:hypothetical protein